MRKISKGIVKGVGKVALGIFAIPFLPIVLLAKLSVDADARRACRPLSEIEEKRQTLIDEVNKMYKGLSPDIKKYTSKPIISELEFNEVNPNFNIKGLKQMNPNVVKIPFNYTKFIKDNPLKQVPFDEMEDDSDTEYGQMMKALEPMSINKTLGNNFIIMSTMDVDFEDVDAGKVYDIESIHFYLAMKFESKHMVGVTWPTVKEEELE